MKFQMILKNLVLIQMNQIYLVAKSIFKLRNLLGSSENNEDDDDLEIPAFLEKTKN